MWGNLSHDHLTKGNHPNGPAIRLVSECLAKKEIYTQLVHFHPPNGELNLVNYHIYEWKTNTWMMKLYNLYSITQRRKSYTPNYPFFTRLLWKWDLLHDFDCERGLIQIGSRVLKYEEHLIWIELLSFK